MRVHVRDGDELIDSRTFGNHELSIGSGDKCEIRLPDRRVSARQAVLIPRNDGTWQLDAGENGNVIQLNGRPIHGVNSVKHADEIEIFNYTIALYKTADDELKDSVKPVATNGEASKLRSKPLPPGAVVRQKKDDVTLTGLQTMLVSRIHHAAASCVDIPSLIDVALNTLIETFGAHRAYVGARKKNYAAFEYEHGRTNEGRTIGPPADFENYQFRCLEAGQLIFVPRLPGSKSVSILAVPLSCGRGELGIFHVERKSTAESFGPEHLGLLVHVASAFASQLERIVEQQAKAVESVNDGRLSFVREAQARMDPTTVPQWDGLQVAVYCKPGSIRGGDVFDIMRLPNGLAAFLVANLTGDETQAALSMVATRAAFRVACLHADPPHVFLRAMNWMLAEDRSNVQMQAVMIVMNPKTGALEISSAGSAGAVIIDTRGDSRDLVDHDAPPVGQAPGFNYGPKSDRIDPEETLALFTGGCYTICNPEGEALGEDRFVESVRDGFGQSANVALDELVADHSEFFKDGHQPDDITILLLHRVGARG